MLARPKPTLPSPLLSSLLLRLPLALLKTRCSRRAKKTEVLVVVAAGVLPKLSSRSRSSRSSRGGQRLSDMEREFDGCGLAKPAPSPGARRSGGVLTLVLACGTVCHVDPCAGFESATQIYGMLGEVVARRALDYVVYDNACMLRRFVANKVSKLPSGVGQDLSRMHYVLDRFHEKGHKACLNPTRRLYDPLVRLAVHPRLQSLNSSQNEQWNSWADNFQSLVRGMCCWPRICGIATSFQGVLDLPPRRASLLQADPARPVTRLRRPRPANAPESPVDEVDLT